MTDPRNPMMFHTGIVVTDIGESASSIGAALGLTFLPPHVTKIPVRSVIGEHTLEMLVTYSLEGPHHLELLQLRGADADAIREAAPRLDHLGAWADDVQQQIDQLQLLGFTTTLSPGGAPGEVGPFAFLAPPGGGLQVELVGSEWRPGIEARLEAYRTEAGQGD